MASASLGSFASLSILSSLKRSTSVQSSLAGRWMSSPLLMVLRGHEISRRLRLFFAERKQQRQTNVRGQIKYEVDESMKH